jgi:outer membrane protein TolC
MRGRAVILVLCALAAPGRAQTLSLTEAVQRARGHAPQRRAAAALRVAAQARQREVLAGLLPSVNAAAVYTAGFPGSGGNLPVRGMINAPFISQWAAGIEGSWSVLEVLRAAPRLGALRQEELAARGEEQRADRDVALQIVDGFERALAAEAGLRILLADEAARQAHLSALSALAGRGVIPEVDVLQARAGLARIAAERARIAAERDVARAALVALTGEPRLAAAALVLDVPPAGPPGPEAAIARARREQARRLRLLPRLELVPRLVLGGSAGYANPPAGQAPGLWAAGAAVHLPLLGILAERPRHEAAAALAEAQVHDAERLALEVEVEIRRLRARLAGLFAEADAAAITSQAARAALAAVEARARAGLAREVEVEASRAVAAQAAASEAVLQVRIQAAQARLALIGPGPQ